VTESRRIARYTFLEEIVSTRDDQSVVLWRGFDEVLARDVSIRLFPRDDPRSAALVGAAQASALVEDRRLLRILDVFDVPATSEAPATIAIVSEWATGVTIQEMMQSRNWEPLPLKQAISIVDDVARAVAAGVSSNVNHGRLRPSSVVMTDAHEVRVRGLAVDAALWGQCNPALTPDACDVDSLGSLLYLLLTGVWPGSGSLPGVGLPRAPRVGQHVLPPSRISASVPRTIDDCVARSVQEADRPRTVRLIKDAPAFAMMLGLSRDYVAAPTESSPSIIGGNPTFGTTGRVLACVGGVVAVAVVGLLGWALANTGPSAWSPNPNEAAASMLTGTATPVIEETEGIEQVIPVVTATSFDPYSDDNDNGKPDGRKGRENEAAVPLAIDGDQATAWTTSRYRSADGDGKGGVGIILDLGETHSVNAVSIDFDGSGAEAEVRVADKVYRDPGTWNLLASAPAGGRSIELRSPRPKIGRYVLLWFPSLPESPTSPGSFSLGVSGVEVRG
jgi:hypothetical protein